MVGFFVSRGDPTERLQAAEEVFNEVPPAVGMEIAVYLSHSVGFWRDNGNSASLVQLCTQPVGIERFVTQKHVEFQILDQWWHANKIMTLPGQKNKADEIAKRVDQRDDLRGQSAPRTPDRLTMSPPLAPVPCWWTRTIVPSIMAYSKSRSPDNRSNRTSKTPLTAQRRKRRKFEFQLPKLSGKSRHAAPVPAIHSTASRNLLLSAAERPRSPTFPGSSGSTLSHCSSFNACRSKLALPSPTLNPIRAEMGIP
jgi:hypothetical protein